ncbi:MAG: hypothetical protein PSX71_11910 [bacterium]|nr:hypothetical protein [bacterium]
MTTIKPLFKCAALLALGLALSACGGGGTTTSSTGGTGTGGSGVPGTSLAVSPSLGLVRHASLRVLDLAGQELASGAMDDSGLIDLPVDLQGKGFIVELRGGPGATYYDEGMDTWLPLPASTVLHAVSAEGRTQMAVTALTEIAYRRALHLADGGALTATFINQANSELADWLARVPESIGTDGTEVLPTEIPSVLDPVVPADGNDLLQRTDAPGRYAIFLAGLSRYAYIRAIENNLPCLGDSACSPLLALIDDLASDFSDGVLDDNSPDGALHSPFFRPGGNLAVQSTYQGNFYVRNDLTPDQEIGDEFAGTYVLSCEGDSSPTQMRVLTTGEVALTGPHGVAWLGKHSEPEWESVVDYQYFIKETGKGFMARSGHLVYNAPYYDTVPDDEVTASASGSVVMKLQGTAYQCTTVFTRGELNPPIPPFTRMMPQADYTCLGNQPDAIVSVFPTYLVFNGVMLPQKLDGFKSYTHGVYNYLNMSTPNLSGQNPSITEDFMYGSPVFDDTLFNSPWAEFSRGSRKYGEPVQGTGIQWYDVAGFHQWYCPASTPSI